MVVLNMLLCKRIVKPCCRGIAIIAYNNSCYSRTYSQITRLSISTIGCLNTKYIIDQPNALKYGVCVLCNQNNRRLFHWSAKKERSESSKICFQTSNQLRQYSSYSSLHPDISEPVVVNVDLKLEEQFKHITSLDRNIQMRGLDINVYNLSLKYKQLTELRNIRREIEEERENLHFEIKKKATGSKIEFEELKQKSRNMKMELKDVNADYNKLEHELMLDALKWPTALHSTASEERVVLHEVGSKKIFDFKLHNHVEIGERNHMIKFSNCSPGAYYLKSRLAEMAYSLEIKLEDIMKHYSVSYIRCPDMTKTVVVEGCGLEFENEKHVFKLQPHAIDEDSSSLSETTEIEEKSKREKWESNLYLTGVSPLGIIAYLIRMNISRNCLPLKYYSIGTSYNPKSMHCSSDLKLPSLLLAPQASVLELFGCTKTEADMEAVYEEYNNIMEHIYDSLQIPYRIIQVKASELDIMEATRREVHIWMPSMNEYVKAGWVSMWNDFASRRLMIKQHVNIKDARTADFVYTVHGTIVHMPTLLAAIMENFQTSKGSFEVPDNFLS